MPTDQVVKTGLGTGIVEALAKQLGAKITVASVSPGTRVSVEHTYAGC
jgi:signal transduction histidine kinase